MLKYFLLLLTIVIVTIVSFGQSPVPAAGTIRRFENFPSRYIRPRNVDVWLPDKYSSSKKYNVLYMHDGQMLFDSTVTWNRQEWKVDETISLLLQEGRLKEVIVVGIWNIPRYRFAEYFPAKAFNYLPPGVKSNLLKRELGGKVESDNYLLFMVKELKPFIDSSFSTYADAQHTFVAGSSMGGLVSLYAICEYPHVFSGAACMSTHWPGSLVVAEPLILAAFLKYLHSYLPSPRNHKIYFDYGTETLDRHYKVPQLKVDQLMKEKGYNSCNWQTIEFSGDDHSERSWSKRLNIPLLFLLGKEQ
jgi:enterochelin esterase-like enzyme